MTPDARPALVRVDDGVRAWRITWLVIFAIARRSGGLMRLLRTLGLPTTHEIVELRLVGRKTGLGRTVLIGMSRIDGHLYVGHPNGSTAWLANLGAGDAVTLLVKHEAPIQVHPTPLGLGSERDAAIRATGRQEWLFIRPFYWASLRHILRAGVYYRLDVIPQV